MSLLISVTANSCDEHVYTHLVAEKGDMVILMAIYARKNVCEWQRTNNPVLVSIEQINNFIGGLNKARQHIIEREVCDG